jgi:hypothetical protein
MGHIVCGPSRITVAITPTWPWDPTGEAAMIKAALTYAGQISVISPTTVLLREAQRLRQRTLGQQIEILRHVIPRMTVEADETARRLRGLALAAAALRRMPSDPNVRGTVLSQVASTTRTIVDIADGLLAGTELTEFAAAEAAGIVTYERLPGQDDARLFAAGLCEAVLAHEGETPRETDRRLLLSVYLRKLARHRSCADAVLLLDTAGHSLLGHGRADSAPPSPAGVDPIAELPVFPSASIGELLDVCRASALSLGDVCQTGLLPSAFSRAAVTSPLSDTSVTRLQLAVRQLSDATLEAGRRHLGDAGRCEDATDFGPSIAVAKWPGRDGAATGCWPYCLVIDPADCRAYAGVADGPALVGAPQ